MATSSPEYLPTYSLSVNSSPTTSDYLIAQMSGSNGDTGLINIGTFINTFIQSYIDDSTIDASTITLYESLGWSNE